jgi:thiol-disulfide isomerase/thioredoxin
MKFLVLVLHVVFLSCNFSSAQVRIVKFPELEKMMKGKDTTLIINFWATWCKPCVKELPHFEELQKNYSGKKVKFIFVSLDFKRELNTRVIPFVTKNKLEGEVVLIDEPDYNSWIDKIHPDWSGAIPATLIIDEKQQKHFYEKEFTSYFELEKIVKPLIK